MARPTDYYDVLQRCNSGENVRLGELRSGAWFRVERPDRDRYATYMLCELEDTDREVDGLVPVVDVTTGKLATLSTSLRIFLVKP
jgi:hypothetical protein